MIIGDWSTYTQDVPHLHNVPLHQCNTIFTVYQTDFAQNWWIVRGWPLGDEVHHNRIYRVSMSTTKLGQKTRRVGCSKPHYDKKKPVSLLFRRVFLTFIRFSFFHISNFFSPRLTKTFVTTQRTLKKSKLRITLERALSSFNSCILYLLP